MISIVTEERAKKVSSALKRWFESNKKTEITPEEIMSYLIEQGIYKDDGRNDALQLRKDLRKLEKVNKLDLIDGAYFIQKDTNKKWYFKKV